MTQLCNKDNFRFTLFKDLSKNWYLENRRKPKFILMNGKSKIQEGTVLFWSIDSRKRPFSSWKT